MAGESNHFFKRISSYSSKICDFICSVPSEFSSKRIIPFSIYFLLFLLFFPSLSASFLSFLSDFFYS